MREARTHSPSGQFSVAESVWSWIKVLNCKRNSVSINNDLPLGWLKIRQPAVWAMMMLNVLRTHLGVLQGDGHFLANRHHSRITVASCRQLGSCNSLDRLIGYGVRDLAHELGKKIDLQMLGDDTELDRQASAGIMPGSSWPFGSETTTGSIHS
jgi:hypothetical protein